MLDYIFTPKQIEKIQSVLAEEASADGELGEQSWFRLYVGISEDQTDFLRLLGSTSYSSIAGKVFGKMSFDVDNKLLLTADNGMLSSSSSESELSYLTSHT